MLTISLATQLATSLWRGAQELARVASLIAALPPILDEQQRQRQS